MMQQSRSHLVREYVRDKYIREARQRGDSMVRVVVGDVHRALGFKNRVPLVCQALSSRQFLAENDLTLEKREGPPSGLSTTVVFTYRLSRDRESQTICSGLLPLCGIAKEVFSSLGGGEAFIRGERDQFHGTRKGA